MLRIPIAYTMHFASREFASGLSLSAPGFTPWFDTWVKLYINSVPTVDHEFVRHHLGCVYAVSASSDNPITALRNLSEQHYRHQVCSLFLQAQGDTSPGEPGLG